MRYVYKVEPTCGSDIKKEADRLTITANGDLSLVDVHLAVKELPDGKVITVEDPCPTLVLAKGQWLKVTQLEKV